MYSLNLEHAQILLDALYSHEQDADYKIYAAEYDSGVKSTPEGYERLVSEATNALTDVIAAGGKAPVVITVEDQEPVDNAGIASILWGLSDLYGSTGRGQVANLAAWQKDEAVQILRRIAATNVN